jgi:hypothetical protein
MSEIEQKSPFLQTFLTKNLYFINISFRTGKKMKNQGKPRTHLVIDELLESIPDEPNFEAGWPAPNSLEQVPIPKKLEGLKRKSVPF